MVAEIIFLISDFGTNNLSIARKNNKLGFINKNGEWIIEPNYSNAKDFSNGLAPVEKNGKWGYIDESGEIKIPVKYNDAELFSDNGLAPVKQNGKWGVVDIEGNIVVEPKYEFKDNERPDFLGEYYKVTYGFGEFYYTK